MEGTNKVDKVLKFYLTGGGNPNDIINETFEKQRYWSRIRLEDLFFNKTYKEAGITRPHLCSHGDTLTL